MFLLTFSLVNGSAAPVKQEEPVFSTDDGVQWTSQRDSSGAFFSVTQHNPSESNGDLPNRRRFDEDTSRVANARELTDAERQDILDAHNWWRNEAALGNLNGGKKATRMKKMYWDKELAEHAKKYTRFCTWEHSQTVGWSELSYSYGENMYATSADSGIAADAGIYPLAMEHQYYKHETGGCSREPCGHYTAIVWEDSTRVGCAITECSSAVGLPSSWGGLTILICQYYTPGNWVGKLPYTYSTDGTVGSECGAVGMDNQYPGLCANGNHICDKDPNAWAGEVGTSPLPTTDNRCLAIETCTQDTPLNGENTAYTCGMGDCSFTTQNGVHVPSATTSGNGMTDMGTWKYCYDYHGEGSGLTTCEDWCFMNRNASPPCLGVTTDPSNPGFWFPVTTVTQLESAAGGVVSSINCGSGPGPTNAPATPSPTSAQATPTPTSAQATPTPTNAQATPSPTNAQATPSPTYAQATPSPTNASGGQAFATGEEGSPACPQGYSRLTSATATQQDCENAAAAMSDVTFRGAEDTETWANGCYLNPSSTAYKAWWNVGKADDLDTVRSSTKVVCVKTLMPGETNPPTATPAPIVTPAPTTRAPTTPAPTVQADGSFVRGETEGCPAGYSRLTVATSSLDECEQAVAVLTANYGVSYDFRGLESYSSWPHGCYIYGSSTKKIYYNTGGDESVTKSGTEFVCKADGSAGPTTMVPPTTSAPTSASTFASTSAPTTSAPTSASTSASTSAPTFASTTLAPTPAQTTPAPAPSTPTPTTSAPTTPAPTTSSPTTAEPITSAPTTQVTPAPTTPTAEFVQGDENGACPEHYERMTLAVASDAACVQAAAYLNDNTPGVTFEFHEKESHADWPQGCYVIDSSLDCFKPEADHFELFHNQHDDASVTRQGANVMCQLSGAAPAPTPMPVTPTPSPTNPATPTPTNAPATPSPTTAAPAPTSLPTRGSDDDWTPAPTFEAGQGLLSFRLAETAGDSTSCPAGSFIIDTTNSNWEECVEAKDVVQNTIQVANGYGDGVEIGVPTYAQYGGQSNRSDRATGCFTSEPSDNGIYYFYWNNHADGVTQPDQFAVCKNTVIPTMSPTQAVPAPINGQDVFAVGDRTEYDMNNPQDYTYTCPEGYSRMTTAVATEKLCNLAARSHAETRPTSNTPDYSRPEADYYQPNGCTIYSYTSATKGRCYTVYWNIIETPQIRRASEVMCILNSYLATPIEG